MILISGVGCGQCKVLERRLNKENIPYEKRMARDNMSFCVEHEISILPTLVVRKLDGIVIYRGLSECLSYMKTIT